MFKIGIVLLFLFFLINKFQSNNPIEDDENEEDFDE
jgi:hypothetical protein